MVQVAGKKILEFSHAKIPDLLAKFNCDPEGLTQNQADSRLEKQGSNQIAAAKQASILTTLLEAINPLNILLVLLAFLSLAIGDLNAATVILVIVGLSIILTTFQEYRAAKAVENLRLMVKTTATVIRRDYINRENEESDFCLLSDGAKKEVEIKDLVAGDIIHLAAGDIIPADIRLISSKDLFINQASLTGESLPIEKFANLDSKNKSKNPLELENICFMGSNVVSGTAKAIVIMTGKSTFFGRLASKAVAKKLPTSFDKGLKNYTWLMIRLMLIMVPIVFLLNGFKTGDWFSALLFSIAIAIGLTPEVLPMIVSINLARGALSMSKAQVIVKNLSSIQNFGAMDVFCSDKTGTLTQDKIILEKYVDLNGEENGEVLRYAYLNSYYQTGLKNLMDRAILDHGDANYDNLLDENYTKLDEIPFDFSRRRMSVVLEDKIDTHLLICKGAVEEILENSSKALQDGKEVKLTKTKKDNFLKLSNNFNEDGFRVIAIAYKKVSNEKTQYQVSDESELTLIGFMAFLDPPKETTTEAVSLLAKHGVMVKILTGDNLAVTRKICHEVGIESQHSILGTEIDEMSDANLAKIVKKTTIFAKLSPFHKERIVKALQKTGHVVGFMGDGINDAAALKVADVGISVDSAVDVAKESADIVLLEKSLLVLEKGLLKGRMVFGNIVKYIKMGSSSNFGNMFSVVGASWFLPFLPLLPIQILTNNLLYDFSQAAIATDKVDDEYLEKPRKWDMGEIKKFMFTMGPISSFFDYVIFAILILGFGALTNAAFFQTSWFVYSVISQTFIVHVIRTKKIPFIQSRASTALTVASILIILIGVYLPFSMLATALGLVQLPLSYFILLFLVVALYAFAMQWAKNKFFSK